MSRPLGSGRAGARLVVPAGPGPWVGGCMGQPDPAGTGQCSRPLCARLAIYLHVPDILLNRWFSSPHIDLGGRVLTPSGGGTGMSFLVDNEVAM